MSLAYLVRRSASQYQSIKYKYPESDAFLSFIDSFFLYRNPIFGPRYRRCPLSYSTRPGNRYSRYQILSQVLGLDIAQSLTPVCKSFRLLASLLDYLLLDLPSVPYLHHLIPVPWLPSVKAQEGRSERRDTKSNPDTWAAVVHAPGQPSSPTSVASARSLALTLLRNGYCIPPPLNPRTNQAQALPGFKAAEPSNRSPLQRRLVVPTSPISTGSPGSPTPRGSPDLNLYLYLTLCWPTQP